MVCSGWPLVLIRTCCSSVYGISLSKCMYGEEDLLQVSTRCFRCLASSYTGTWVSLLTNLHMWSAQVWPLVLIRTCCSSVYIVVAVCMDVTAHIQQLAQRSHYLLLTRTSSSEMVCPWVLMILCTVRISSMKSLFG